MKRILSLLPSATEIVFELGAGTNLVAVTHECDFPPAARLKPQVTGAKIDPSMPSPEIDRLVRSQLDDSGTLYTLDMEKVRELRPELVLTQQLCTVCAVGYETVQAAMRSLPEPPTVMNLEPRTLDEVFATFVEVARELEIEERGHKLVEKLRARLAALPRIDPAPRVLFLEWVLPPFSAGHWMADVIEAAGGVPVMTDRGRHSRQVDWEQIRAAEFDVLVVACCGFDLDRTIKDVAACPEIRELYKQREIRVIIFDGNQYFSRPGPRLVESAEFLSAALTQRPQDMRSAEAYAEMMRIKIPQG